jgi:hypothetical protein
VGNPGGLEGRNLKRERGVTFVAGVTVEGCTSPSPITPCGQDSYIVTVDDTSGGRSPGRLQVKAAQKASKYCPDQGKVVRVRNTSGEGVTGWKSASSTLVFSCISEDDPESTRPDLRSEADTASEDLRR